MVGKTDSTWQPIFASSPAVARKRVGSAITLDQPARRLAEIIPLSSSAIGKKRLQKVRPLARACGDDSPDLRARKIKQAEKPVEGLPSVVEITYASGTRVWCYRYRDPITGRKNCITLGTVGEMSYIDMVALVARYRTDLAAGRSPRAWRMPLAVFVTVFYEPWVRQNQRSWKTTLSRIRRHLLPRLGERALGDINPRDVERLIQDLRVQGDSEGGEQLAPPTINRIVDAGSSVFSLAEFQEFVRRNPFRGARSLKENPPPPVALSELERNRLDAVLEGEPVVFRLLIKLLLTTGLRINEALSLLDSDIDYVNGVIHLRETKTGEAQTAPLTPTVENLVKHLLAIRRPGNRHLFPAKNGDGHIAPPYKTLDRVLAAAEIKAAGFHLFRKTFATEVMQLPGMDTLTASRLLRHKSITTLEKHYLATPQQRLRQAATDVGALLVASERKEVTR